MSYFKYLLVLLFLSSCSKKETISKHETVSKHITFNIIDSVNLNRINNYSFFNFSNYEKNEIYGFNYPQLELSKLNKNGSIIKKITERGEAPGKLNNFIKIALCNEYLFLIECTDIYRIIVFDKNYNYKKTIKIPFESSLFPQVIVSSFNVIRTENELYNLVFTADNNSLSNMSKKFYKKEKAIVEIQMNNKFEIINYKELLPYKNFKTLIKKVNNNNKNWDTSLLNFHYYNNRYFLSAGFLDSIYIYNKTWSLQQKIKLNNYSGFKGGYTTNFSIIKNTEKRLKKEFKLRFLNRNIYYMDVYNDKVFLMYPYEKDEDNVPTNNLEYSIYSPEVIIQIIDTKTNEQKFIKLSNKYSYYNGFKVINDNSFVLLSNPLYQEDIHLYIIKYEN